MTIGVSIFLIAVGAILAFAVNLGQVGPVEIQTIGYILLIIGVLGLILGLFLLASARRGAADDRDVA